MNQWLGSVVEVTRRAPGLAFLIALVWFALPFLTQMIIHPDDVIRLEHLLEGDAVPHTVGAQQLGIGVVYATIMIVSLGLLLLGLLTVLYHRLQFALTIWPIAALALGGIGNLVWYQVLGFVDNVGIVIGFVPAALTVIWQRAAEGWAQDFVFGRGQRPRHMGYR